MSNFLLQFIIELLAENIGEEMDQNEGLLGFPRDIHWVCLDGRPDTPSRTLLNAMSLVCRGWAKPAQYVLRRRIFLKGPFLQQLINSPGAGPWVRELQYWEYNQSEHMEEKAVMLAQLLNEKLTNLTALSIGSEYLTSWPSNIVPYLGCLSSAPYLRALHIQCFMEPNSLPRMCEAIASLHNLETLSVMGMWEDEGGHYCSAPELSCTQPPPSLKKLLLRVECNSSPSHELITWLLRARGGYALQELRVVITLLEQDEDDREQFDTIVLESLKETLPTLKTLLLGDSCAFSIDVQKMLISRCTSLRELHLYADPEHPLPRTLERLCWGHDTFQRFGTIEFDDMVLSRYLQRELASREVRTLHFVHILNVDDEEFYLETKKVCEEHGIKFVRGCDLVGTWSRASE